MTKKPLRGVLYFVTLIGDHSRKVQVSLSKRNNQVLKACKEFYTTVEPETKEKLKSVWVDNGGKYCGPIENISIKWLSQNVELYHLRNSKMYAFPCQTPFKSFQREVVKIVLDIINLSSSLPLDGEILEEIWSGKTVTYNNLKVFSHRGFMHIPKDKGANLDSKIK